MRCVKAVASATALVLFAGVASAQEKPNFAGKWTLDAEKTAAANPNAGGGGGGGGGGRRGGGLAQALTLALDAASLTSTVETQNGPQSTTYKLDGSEQTVTTMGPGEAKATAKWDGNKIVVVTVRQIQGNEVRTTTEYTMEGEHLVVATTRPPRGGGDPVTRKGYYKKS